MIDYKYVFIILVYRNIIDLDECINSIIKCCSSFKIVIVNSFYDNKTRKEAENVAEKFGCDFLNVENKGYSYGNNSGITHAVNRYNFEYIVISNPDIIIEKFNDSLFQSRLGHDIIAPKIIASNGRLQNPMYIKKPHFSEWLEYCGFKHKNNTLVRAGITLSRLERIFQMLFRNKQHFYQIYAAHGSFVLLSRHTIDVLKLVYDENIFLFAEEMVLAAKSRGKGLKTYYCTDIVIRHKEDGSMKLSNFKLYDELRKSNMYYYDKYVRSY